MSESDQTGIEARRPAREKQGLKRSGARKRGGNTRQHVLDCAARLFRMQGYAATSLRDIAAASGMKPGSLYYHFPSKEMIVIDRTLYFPDGSLRIPSDILGLPECRKRSALVR